MDVDEFARLGLYDPDQPSADRLELLRFLVGHGCTAAEMVAAHRHGRLFALAGDRLIDPGPARHTLAAAAAAAGIDEEDAALALGALGLAQLAGTGATLSDADVHVLTTWRSLCDLVGRDAALGGYRVLGAAMARVAEAEASVFRAANRQLDLGVTGSEAVTARAYAEVAGVLPRIDEVLTVAHRRHLAVARRHFEQIVDAAGRVTCGVGFADVAGYTALSRTLPLDQLAGLVSAIESVTSEIVRSGGGRVVKHIGDAVMFVAASPVGLADLAHRLLNDPRAHDAGLQGRAGIAWGPMVAQDGDYFGTPVNLAARLLAVARPGEVAADPQLAEALRAAGWRWRRLAARPLRGFEAPVAPLVLTGPPAG